MPTVDPFTHMEEAWKLEANPFPSGGIRKRPDEPFSDAVFPEETAEFYKKLVRGAVFGNRSIGFLWSQGPGGDTGYGKTTLMQVTAARINQDLGADILHQAGVKQDRITPIAAAYANLNNLNAAGLYPVFFNAVVDAASSPPGGQSLFDQARARISAEIGSTDAGDIKSHLAATKVRIAPASAPLRTELVDAFTTDGGRGVLAELNNVSQASRLRNGIQYLDFLIAVLAAAGIDHLFLFVDQLEDLATNRAINSTKRSREIGRIRDLLEMEPYVSRLHFVFTFHNTAAKVLEPYWQVNRLPRFEIAPDNTASVVVLRGIARDEQVAELLRVYLQDKRFDSVEDDLLPFDPAVLGVLRQVSRARVGILLGQAHELIQTAAQEGLPRISSDFARRYFEGALDGQEPITEDEPGTGEDVDDILLR